MKNTYTYVHNRKILLKVISKNYNKKQSSILFGHKIFTKKGKFRFIQNSYNIEFICFFVMNLFPIGNLKKFGFRD